MSHKMFSDISGKHIDMSSQSSMGTLEIYKVVGSPVSPFATPEEINSSIAGGDRRVEKIVYDLHEDEITKIEELLASLKEDK